MIPDFISQWVNSHQTLVTWFSIGSIVVFFISLISLPWLAASIPEDYFSHKKRHPKQWQSQHPILRMILIALKNVLGLVLLAGGIIMLLIPGQGLLTILAGLVLMNYPGKYQLERKVIQMPSLYKSINWLRSRRSKPPIIID